MEKKRITDKQGNQILPITHVSAVLDDNGNDLVSVMGTFEDEVRGLVDTPHQGYVTVEATSQTSAATDVLPASGQSADTIYRVSNWDGSTNSYDITVYSEYAWDDVSNPNKYIFLCVKPLVGEVFDITVYNNNTKYANLAAALGTNGVNVPASVRKGGMSIKYVNSSDNKYVRFNYLLEDATTNSKFVNVANWQGVDDEPTAGSNNLVKSGGVAFITQDNTNRIDYIEKIAAPSNLFQPNYYSDIADKNNYRIRGTVFSLNRNINNIQSVFVRRGNNSGYSMGSLLLKIYKNYQSPASLGTPIVDVYYSNGIYTHCNNGEFIELKLPNLINIEQGVTYALIVNDNNVFYYSFYSGFTSSETGHSDSCFTKSLIKIDDNYVESADVPCLWFDIYSSEDIEINNSILYLDEYTSKYVDLDTKDIVDEISNQALYKYFRYSCNIRKGQNYSIINRGSFAISMKTTNSINPDGSYSVIDSKDSINIGAKYSFTASDDARFILIYAKTGCKYSVHLVNNATDSIDLVNNILETNLLNRKVVNNATGANYGHVLYNLKIFKGESYKITLIENPAITFWYSVDGTVESRVSLFTLNNSGSSDTFIAPADAYLGAYQKSPSSWSFEHVTQVNYTEKGRAKTVINNGVSLFDAVKCPSKDVYVSLLGDSITAFPSSDVSANEGVTRVPAVCDRQAVANGIWEAFKYGNVQYRRFDDGKASLVGDYSDLWSDDSEAFFIENGDFYTQYERNAIERAQSHIGVTTKIDTGHFSEKFDSSEGTNQSQRNIPKRFSNSANASITFEIPAGYSKFDFIFHAHILGDTVTIATNRNNGIVKYNRKPNDWSNGVEANNAVIDLSMEPYTIPNGGNDSIGNPNMRIHFNISDTTSATIVTVTKSSDTSKYLIYQGIAFWGTSNEPYGIHVNNMAIGGELTSRMYQLRDSVIRATNPTAIVLECCLNDQTYYTISNAEASINTVLSNFKTYLNSLLFSLNDVCLWIPHISGSGYNTYNERTHWITKNFSRIAKNLDFCVYLEMYKILEACRDVYQPQLTMYDFMMQYKNGGEQAVHLNYNGYQYFAGAFESL